MDDPAYIVSHKTCGKCQYYSRNSAKNGIKCCNYTLLTGKARPLVPMKECPVRKYGKQLPIPTDWNGLIGKGIAVCME